MEKTQKEKDKIEYDKWIKKVKKAEKDLGVKLIGTIVGSKTGLVSHDTVPAYTSGQKRRKRKNKQKAIAEKREMNVNKLQDFYNSIESKLK